MQGRVVLVTGAAKGIGKEVARQLAGLGAAVLISARNADHAQATAEELTLAGTYAPFRSPWTSPTTSASRKPPRPWSGTLGAWTS